MKTAMEQLLEYFNEDILLPANWQEKFLEKEKQQIIEAHEKGQGVYCDVIRLDKSKQYYNEHFN